MASHSFLSNRHRMHSLAKKRKMSHYIRLLIFFFFHYSAKSRTIERLQLRHRHYFSFSVFQAFVWGFIHLVTFSPVVIQTDYRFLYIKKKRVLNTHTYCHDSTTSKHLRVESNSIPVAKMVAYTAGRVFSR